MNKLIVKTIIQYLIPHTVWYLSLVKGVNDVIRNWDPTTVKNKIATIGTSLALSCLASQVFAAGFQIQEQSVTYLGTAYSGTAALAEDATTGFYNPAGLTRIPDGQIVLSGIVIQGDFELNATSATNPLGLPLGSGDANPGTVVGIPTFHLAKRLDERWVFGFNITVPFGLSSKYDSDDIARYLATESTLQSTDIGFSIAYQPLPCFSIAAGPDVVFTQVTLNAQTLNPVTDEDGFQRNKGDGFGYAWHAGALWEPTENTRVGVNWRSNVNTHIDGNTESVGLVSFSPFTISGLQNEYYMSQVDAQVTLPETATVSLYHRFAAAPCLAVLADISWTNWSRFHTLKLRYDRPLPTNIPLPGRQQFALLTPDTDTAENFRDARRFALGFTYTHDDCWLFRIGGSYDETPVRNEFRTLRLPDSNRYWLAVGGAYTYNKAWRIDFGYAHLFFNDAALTEHAPFGGQSNTPLTAATLQGDFNSSANLLGLQVRYDFI